MAVPFSKLAAPTVSLEKGTYLLSISIFIVFLKLQNTTLETTTRWKQKW